MFERYDLQVRKTQDSVEVWMQDRLVGLFGHSDVGSNRRHTLVLYLVSYTTNSEGVDDLSANVGKGVYGKRHGFDGHLYSIQRSFWKTPWESFLERLPCRYVIP